MLAHVVGECWHALVRDILVMGFRVDDMFTTLGLSDMVSIVVAAPPGSSVRYYLDEGWSRTDHLIANMTEHRAGLVQLPQAYSRPGAEQRPAAPPGGDGFFRAEAITWEEADRRDKIRYSGQFRPSGPTKVRLLSAIRTA